MVVDFLTVRQRASSASVCLDDAAVADLFEQQVDAGRRPEQFARIWLHTHPGRSPHPSFVDEQTFGRVFGACDWAVMFILARDGSSYARLRFGVGPGGEMPIGVTVDYTGRFGGSDRDAWEAEYQANIIREPVRLVDWQEHHAADPQRCHQHGRADLDDLLDDLGEMEPQERHLVLDELASRPELWEEEATA